MKKLNFVQWLKAQKWGDCLEGDLQYDINRSKFIGATYTDVLNDIALHNGCTGAIKAAKSAHTMYKEYLKS